MTEPMMLRRASEFDHVTVDFPRRIYIQGTGEIRYVDPEVWIAMDNSEIHVVYKKRRRDEDI